MKNWIQNLNKKQWIWFGIALVSLMGFAILMLVSHSLKTSLSDQRAAQRWSNDDSFAQISCFFADTELIGINEIMSFRNQIEKSLGEAAYASNEGKGRSYIDAYSSYGTVNIISGQGSLDTKAVGIGGDFFLFHPLTLVNGAYFSGHDLMKDSVILDEEAAWHLFGSFDIIGMPVLIGDVPHYVRGVIKRERGRLWEAAGLNSGVAYLSEESLSAYGRTSGVHHYEAVMPNPVSGFAYRVAAEKFGYTEDKMMVLDNTARYDLEALIQIIAEAGLRSMQSYAIRFPYWENYARGMEDIIAFILVFQVVFLLMPILIIMVMIIILYRQKRWTWLDVFANFYKWIASKRT